MKTIAQWRSAHRKHPWEKIIRFLRDCPFHNAFQIAAHEFGLTPLYIRTRLYKHYGLTLTDIRGNTIPAIRARSRFMKLDWKVPNESSI